MSDICNWKCLPKDGSSDMSLSMFELSSSESVYRSSVTSKFLLSCIILWSFKPTLFIYKVVKLFESTIKRLRSHQTVYPVPQSKNLLPRAARKPNRSCFTSSREALQVHISFLLFFTIQSFRWEVLNSITSAYSQIKSVFEMTFSTRWRQRVCLRPRSRIWRSLPLSLAHTRTHFFRIISHSIVFITFSSNFTQK